MANDAYTQQALAGDARFILRVQAALITVAFQVLNEAIGGAITQAIHDKRVVLARQVLVNPAAWAAQMAPVLVMRTNILSTATAYDFSIKSVTSAVSDAALESQISSDWNVFAGV